MPRWRTMIEPAVTSWPSPALTPSRWPTLSRPFLTLPPAFLWAISTTRPSWWRAAWEPACVGRPWRRLVVAAFALAAGFVGAAFALAAGLSSVVVAAFASAFAAGLALRLRRGPWPSARPRRASRRARRPWRPGPQRPPRGAGARPSRSALAFFAASSAALFPPNTMSLMRRTVSSWRWPFLTRRRAFGRYLKLIGLLAAGLADDLGADRRRRRRPAGRSRPRRRRRRGGRARW